MRITAILDHKLRVARDELPADLRSHLVDALTIPNLAKREAEKQHQWGWEQMPDKIALYSLDGDHMVMPRGFSADFADGMYLSGHDVEWTDNRYFPTMPEIGEHPDLRPWQIPAWAAMRQFQQGIYKAPAGSGKTVTMLGLIQTLATPSLVIVNTKDILWQWQKRAREFLGADYPVGQIGDGIFEVSDYLTIATAQTLHSRFDNLEAAGFFDSEFGLVLDVHLLLAALDLEQRRLGDVDVPALDELGHLTVKEGQQQGPDVAAVDVRVGHDDHAVIAQVRAIEVVAADTGAERADQRHHFLR